ncbi:hypothetical protein H6761_02640 [Candidatus Nomurabacteria bacterium]|nr:hypothetical protein [Candidatus Nomurabacteria bacterium]
MSFKELTNLPVEVQDLIFSDELTDKNIAIADQFALNQDQLDFVLDLEEKIWLKKISVLDLPKELEKMEKATEFDLRALSLELAYQIFWPLQEYLKNVDRLILRLGGKVPKFKALEKTSARLNQKLPQLIKGAVKFLLEKYPELSDYRLSSKKIISKEKRSVSPTVANWLNDYVHFLGAGYHDSLQRSKYLAKSQNVLELSRSELESVRHFLTSYDDNLPVEIDLSDVVLRISLVEEVTEKSAEKPEQSLKEIVKNIYQKFLEIQNSLLSTNLILAETDNSLHKLRDVLWQALALQDQDKVLSCLKVMIEKKALDLMLAEDKRFQGLLKRFVSIRYGDQVSWNSQDKLLLRRIFFEMILSDKLNLNTQEATLSAFYLVNLFKQSGQLVYLDQKSGSLKWRDLDLVNNQIVWRDNI